MQNHLRHTTSSKARSHQPNRKWRIRTAAKSAALFLCALAAWTAHGADVALPFYDPFPTSYGDGVALGSGASATSWTIGNSVGSNGLTNRSSAALNYPGLAAASGLGVVMPPPGSSGTFGAGNPTLYISFLLNIQTSPTAVRSLAYARNSTGSGTPALGLFVSTANTLQVSKSSTTPAAAASGVLPVGTTHLVVLRYKWNSASGDDEVALWLDPGSLGAAENAVPGSTTSTTSGTDVTTLLGFRFRQQSGDTGTYWVDEVRIGATWASVTPSGCTPPAVFGVSGGGAYCAGGSGVLVGLTNSEVGINYQLKLNGVETGSPITGSGSALDFGLQTAAGTYTVSGSNTTTACVGPMTGNAVVTVNNPPSISLNPTNLTVCSGATASFSVAATGAGLSYQWQVDTGGGFVNVTTGTGGNLPTYTTAILSPPDDQSHYRCIVSGTCSPSATSSTATVTVASGVSINSNPTSQTVSVGSKVALSVGASGPGLTYQWQFSTDNGSSFNNVSSGTGGTSAIYTTAPLTLADDGTRYKCVVTATCGAPAETTAAIVTVKPAIYRSLASGVWSALESWEQSYNGSTWVPATTTPTSDNTTNILVRGGHSLAVTNAVTVDDLTIQANGEVDASGAVLTISHGGSALDCDVFGTLQVANVANSGLSVNANGVLKFESGGHYIWNAPATAAFPTALWADGSLAENQAGNNTGPSGLTQDFYDFFWNRTASGQVSLSNRLTTVRHNLRMKGSSDSGNSVRFLAATATNDLRVGGDVLIEEGFITCSGASTPNTVLNLIMGGNMVIFPGANLDSRNSGVGSANNFVFTNTSITQVISNSGSIGHTGTGGGTPNNWIVSAGVTVYLALGNIALGTANNSTRDSVIIDGTLNLGTNQITGPGDLLCDPAGTLVGNGTNQLTTGLNGISYGGTLNLGVLPTLNLGDNFKLFDAGAYSGSFTSIVPASPGNNLSWDTSQLPVSGTLVVGSPSSVNTNPTNITAAVSGSTLELSWPADHTGWTLQTNAAGLGNPGGWFPYPGSAATNRIVITVNPSKPTVFYRLSYR